MEKALSGSMEVFSALDITSKTAGFDAANKKLLQYREILAVILKGTIEEYQNYSVEEIMDFIEADSISSAEVSRSRTNTLIQGEFTEFNELNEKTSVFDVRFKAKNPQLSTEKIFVNLHVDIEPQKNYRPGYPIEKRGLYYLARSLGTQLSLVTEGTDYSNLEKCYSIWICRDNIPLNDRFSISHYKIENSKNIGKCVPKNEDYDLLQLVIIRLGSSEYSGMEYDLFRFLTALFYPHKPGFRKVIENYIDFSGNEELKKEVARMSGLGESILEEGRQEGHAAGLNEGRLEGIRALILDNLEEGTSPERIAGKLMKRFSLTEEEAATYVEQYGSKKE